MVKEVVGSMEGKRVMERVLGDGDGETDVEGAALRSENEIDPYESKTNKQMQRAY